MINKKLNKLILNYFYILLFLIFSINYSHSENLKSIIIEGNDRLANETIILFSQLDINSEVNDNVLNDALKNLYETKYFKDVKFNFNNNILYINIVENPVIQTVTIEGIKSNNLLTKLEELTKKNEKYPFLLNEINEQKNLLENILRTNGYYFQK